MTLSSYPYRFVMNEHSHEDYLAGTSIYTFRSTKSNLVYLVRVEHYRMDVYIIKFYLKNNRNSPHKYSLLTNTFEPRRILNTTGAETFHHHYNVEKSAYILVNKRKLKENPSLIAQIEQFFTDIYPSLED